MIADSPLARALLAGFVAYMYLSSLVDFHAYTPSIDNAASLPSIAFRILPGTILLLLMFKDWGLMVPGAFPCGIKVVQRIKSGTSIFGEYRHILCISLSW